jgi:hypothetical protein
MGANASSIALFDTGILNRSTISRRHSMRAQVSADSFTARAWSSMMTVRSSGAAPSFRSMDALSHVFPRRLKDVQKRKLLCVAALRPRPGSPAARVFFPKGLRGHDPPPHLGHFPVENEHGPPAVLSAHLIFHGARRSGGSTRRRLARSSHGTGPPSLAFQSYRSRDFPGAVDRNARE